MDDRISYKKEIRPLDSDFLRDHWWNKMLLKKYIVKIKWNWVEGHCVYKGGWETAALRLYLWDKTQNLGSPPAPSLQWIPCTVKPSVSPLGSGVTPGMSHPPALHHPPVTADGPFGFLLTAKRRKEKEGTVGQVFNFFQHRVCITFGEGNGNPLQCSCLENPKDGGALVGCHLRDHTESDKTEAT